MKKTILALALATLTLGTLATAADAQVNARQLNQERRIDAGRRSGKLTPHEGAKLRAEQRSIERTKATLKARHGGHLTKRDKRMIHQRQEAANRHILRNKHNRYHGKNHLKI